MRLDYLGLAKRPRNTGPRRRRLLFTHNFFDFCVRLAGNMKYCGTKGAVLNRNILIPSSGSAASSTPGLCRKSSEP